MTTMLSELPEPIQASAPTHEIRTLLDSGFEWQATAEADIVLDDLREQLSHVPGLYDSIFGHAQDFTAKVASPLLFLKLEVTDQKPEDIDTYNPNKIVLYEENGELTGGMMTRIRRLIMGGSGSSMATMTDEEAYMAAFKMKRLVLALGSFRVDDLTALDVDFDALIDTLAALGIDEDIIEEMIALLISGDAPPALVEAVEAIIALGQTVDPADIPAILQRLEASLAEALPQAKSEKVASILGRITQALQRIIKAEPSNLLLGIQTYKTLMALDVSPDVAREMTALIISGDAPPALIEASKAIVALGDTKDSNSITNILQKIEASLSEALQQEKSEKTSGVLVRIKEGLQPVVKSTPATLMPKIQAFQRGEVPKISERLSALKIITNVVQTTAALIRSPDLPKAEKDKLSVTLAGLRANIFAPQSPVFNQSFARLVSQILPIGDKFPSLAKNNLVEQGKPASLPSRIAASVQAITKAALILLPVSTRLTLPLPKAAQGQPSALQKTNLSPTIVQNVVGLITKASITALGAGILLQTLASPRSVTRAEPRVQKAFVGSAKAISRFEGGKPAANNDNNGAKERVKVAPKVIAPATPSSPLQQPLPEREVKPTETPHRKDIAKETLRVNPRGDDPVLSQPREGKTPTYQGEGAKTDVPSLRALIVGLVPEQVTTFLQFITTTISGAAPVADPVANVPPTPETVRGEADNPTAAPPSPQDNEVPPPVVPDSNIPPPVNPETVSSLPVDYPPVSPPDEIDVSKVSSENTDELEDITPNDPENELVEPEKKPEEITDIFNPKGCPEGECQCLSAEGDSPDTEYEPIILEGEDGKRIIITPEEQREASQKTEAIIRETQDRTNVEQKTYENLFTNIEIGNKAVFPDKNKVKDWIKSIFHECTDACNHGSVAKRGDESELAGMAPPPPPSPKR